MIFRKVEEFIFENLIRISAFLVIISLLLIFLFIGKEALPIFFSKKIKEEAGISKLLFPQDKKFVWQPISTSPKYSLLPLFVSTLKATIVAILFALPLAIGAALFTSEFSPPFLKEIIKPTVELLAGVPSVVVGFFALMVQASFLQKVFGFTYRLNAINAGIALGLAVIPIIFTISEDALSSVPKVYREGSFALGANRWQTAWKVVMPAAFPGIFAACVLGFGRAIGETMIVLMASGNAAILSLNFSDSIRTFSATIAAELAEVVVGSAHYHVLFFIGTTLFVITFLINLLGYWFVNRLKKKLEGLKK